MKILLRVLVSTFNKLNESGITIHTGCNATHRHRISVNEP